jgi:putative hemolysin
MSIDIIEKQPSELAFRPAQETGLIVRLARDDFEVEAYQRLRYSVFVDEMGALPTPTCLASGLDIDDFDRVADHLLVFDPRLGEGAAGVVGGYRLIRRSAARRVGRFYTESEFDISPLLARKGEILELGRSCIAPSHRHRNTMQMLWSGVAAYVKAFDVGTMFGCVSLPGSNPALHAETLAYLAERHLAPEDIRPVAWPDIAVPLSTGQSSGDCRRSFVRLPPLLKGYLRLGGWIGDGAVADQAFNTLDLCLVVETDRMTDRYSRHYLKF